MKLSTKSRYGLRAMFELADYHDSHPISLSHIAKNQDISIAYLEQLFAILKKENLINSTRGVQGGYLLAKHPKDITIGMIIRPLEGSIFFSDCTSKNGTCSNDTSYCSSKLVWEKMQNAVNEVIDNTTLQDLLDDKYRGE